MLALSRSNTAANYLRSASSVGWNLLRNLSSCNHSSSEDNSFGGPSRVIYSPLDTELDHDKLQKCTLTRREFIAGLEPPASAGAGEAAAKDPIPIFDPSPASKMCQTMNFGYSFFYKDRYLRPDILARAAGRLAEELPPLTGRVRPPKEPPGLRSMGDTVIELNQKGLEFVLAETKKHTIEDLGPHTWLTGMQNKKLSSFGVPFYTEPFSIDKMYRGEEALFKLKLTRCVDGQILSVAVSHLLADAGRSVRLVERLGQLYRAEGTGKDPGHPLQFNPDLETPKGLAAALKNSPEAWEPPEEDHRLTPWQWLAAPYRLYRHVSKPFDVHMLYLPEVAVKRLKSIAAANSQQKVSTMDSVQAFIATLVADLRRKSLVPTFPEEFTVNVDLLHRDVPYKDPGAVAQHVGNAVHILHVPGVDPGTEVPYPITDCDSNADAIAKLSTAIGMNAQLIRRSVTEFRSDVTNALKAVQRQERMVGLAELRVGAAFVVKGADMKIASTTAVTAFSFNNIDFGSGPPLYAQINYQPRFDWWTIIQSPQGYGDGKGVLCTMTVESGLKDAFLNHVAWKVLAPEAHLFVQGPFEGREESDMAELDRSPKVKRALEWLKIKEMEREIDAAKWRGERQEGHSMHSPAAATRMEVSMETKHTEMPFIWKSVGMMKMTLWELLENVK